MENEKIRRVSMDKFYEIVTGDKEAFTRYAWSYQS